jgi:hypothetical protein
MKKIIIVVSVLSLVFIAPIVFVMPKMYESKIRKEAPGLLGLYDFKVIKEGEFHLFHQSVDYVVTKNDVVDTLSVRLSHGTLSIQSK